MNLVVRLTKSKTRAEAVRVIKNNTTAKDADLTFVRVFSTDYFEYELDNKFLAEVYNWFIQHEKNPDSDFTDATGGHSECVYFIPA